MNQQRSRRFRSQGESKQVQVNGNLPDKSLFDPNCISPGTDFMEFVEQKTLAYIKSLIGEGKLDSQLKIYYSGHKAPGEGEHKIMDFYRYTKSLPDFDPSWTHALLSPDADAIFLGLATHSDNFYVIKEISRPKNPKSNTTNQRFFFSYVSIAFLRHYINFEFIESNKFDSNSLEQTVNDFIILLTMIGNDFISCLPNFHVHKNIVSIIFNAYFKARKSFQDGTFFLDDNGQLHKENLKIFFECLLSFESNTIIENLKPYKNVFSNVDESFELDVDFDNSAPNGISSAFNEDSAHVNINSLYDSQVQLTQGDVYANFSLHNPATNGNNSIDDSKSEETFKKFYYNSKFGFGNGENFAENIQKLCFNYLESIQWIVDYYISGKIAWNWCYNYHYSPFISDLVKYLPSFEYKYESDHPACVEHQLLSILPQDSMHLMHKPYSELYKEKSLEFSKFFPTELKFDLNGKLADWEAVNVLAILNRSAIDEAIEFAKNSEDYYESEHGQILLFTQPGIGFSLHNSFMNDNLCEVLEESFSWDNFSNNGNEIDFKQCLKTYKGHQSTKCFADSTKLNLQPVKRQKRDFFYSHFNKFFDCIEYQMMSADYSDGNFEDSCKLLLKRCYFSWPITRCGLLYSLYDGYNFHKFGYTAGKVIKTGDNFDKKILIKIMDKSMKRRGIVYSRPKYFALYNPLTFIAKSFVGEENFYSYKLQVEHPNFIIDATKAEEEDENDYSCSKIKVIDNLQFKYVTPSDSDKTFLMICNDSLTSSDFKTYPLPAINLIEIFSKYCQENHLYFDALAFFQVSGIPQEFIKLISDKIEFIVDQNTLNCRTIVLGLNVGENAISGLARMSLNNTLEITKTMANFVKKIFSKFTNELNMISKYISSNLNKCGNKILIDRPLDEIILKIHTLFSTYVQSVSCGLEKNVSSSLKAELSQLISEKKFSIPRTSKFDISLVKESIIPIADNENICFTETYYNIYCYFNPFDHVFFTSNIKGAHIGDAGIVVKVSKPQKDDNLISSQVYLDIMLIPSNCDSSDGKNKRQSITLESVPSIAVLPYKKYSINSTLRKFTTQLAQAKSKESNFTANEKKDAQHSDKSCTKNVNSHKSKLYIELNTKSKSSLMKAPDSPEKLKTRSKSQVLLKKNVSKERRKSSNDLESQKEKKTPSPPSLKILDNLFTNVKVASKNPKPIYHSAEAKIDLDNDKTVSFEELPLKNGDQKQKGVQKKQKNRISIPISELFKK